RPAELACAPDVPASSGDAGSRTGAGIARPRASAGGTACACARRCGPRGRRRMTTTPRRPLADTLVELLESVVPAPAAPRGGIRVHDVELGLPLEMRLGDDGVLLGNVRRWRWPTIFDEHPSRLAASFHLIEG